MKIIEQNRNEIILKKKFHFVYGAFVYFFILGVLSSLMFFHENQEIDLLAIPLIFSYTLIIASIVFLLFTGNKVIIFSKMSGDLVVKNNHFIKKTKKRYLLNEIDCIKKKNKRELRRVYGSTRLLKIAKYYLCLKDATLILLFSYVSSDNYVYIGKSNIKENESVLNKLDILTAFLNINIKS